MNILVSGFDPFGNESINPSGEAIRRLASRSPSGVVVRAIELPTVFHRSWALLEKAVLESAPDAVICVGQADRRARISLERFAVNIMDARIPDNDGNQPRDQAIQDRGPQAYRSGLPLRAMEKALFDSGIPAHISDSAGTYVGPPEKTLCCHFTIPQSPGEMRLRSFSPNNHGQDENAKKILPNLFQVHHQHDNRNLRFTGLCQLGH
jgi:pyroglutamyl-peptidase I